MFQSAFLNIYVTANVYAPFPATQGKRAEVLPLVEAANIECSMHGHNV